MKISRRDRSVSVGSWALIAGLAAFGSGQLEARVVRDHRSPSRSGGAFSLMATPVFETELQLVRGQTITCETRNLTPGADPVLHLIPPRNAIRPFAPIVNADDTGTDLNARLTYRVQSSGTHRLILRASHGTTAGNADLLCGGQPRGVQLPVGGVSKSMESIRQGETLTTVPLPKAPRAHVVYVLDGEGRLVSRHRSGASESASIAIGARPSLVVMVGSLLAATTGPVRFVRNDGALTNHDPDRDGLGSELERDIGTCSTLKEAVGNWDCSRSTDARDTDGDGLFDGDELLGRTSTAPFQLLPRWGADPKHKDLFVEVDFRARVANDPSARMDPKDARVLAAIYADGETDPLLRLAHAQALRNPDLQPGIRLHLDTGVDPPPGAPPEDFVTFGNWGGHNTVPASCRADGTCVPAEGTVVWRKHMHPNRFGIFHYALGETVTGGQAPVHHIALNLPITAPGTAAHELAHNLGLNHFGPDHLGGDANCKPNYPSLMSYAYLDQPKFANTFSDGFGRPALNNTSLIEQKAVNPSTAAGDRYLTHLSEVFLFNVDANAGHVDWNRDGVYSAGTVRAYANDNGKGCEMTRTNAMDLAGLTDGAIALTRLGLRTMALYSDERTRKLTIEFTDDPLNCPNPGAGRCGPPFKSSSVDEPWNKGVLSVDAHPIRDRGVRKILVVFRTDAGLFETLLTGDMKLTPPRRVPINGKALDEFSLAGSEDRTTLAFKNQDRQTVTKLRANEAGGVWAADEPMRDTSGNLVAKLSPLGAPGLVEGTDSDGRIRLFLAQPEEALGHLRLYVRNSVTRRWERIAALESEEQSFGRPALAFQPVDPASALKGRLHILSLRRTDGTNFHVVRHHMLEAFGVGSQGVPKMKSGDHDNSSFFGTGVDFLFEPGVDTNLRAIVATAMARKGVEQPHKIQFRPNADGIVDVTMRNRNDWETLGAEICRTKLVAGGTAKCPGLPAR